MDQSWHLKIHGVRSSFIKSNTYEVFESKIGDVNIDSDWYNIFSEDFNVAISKVIPKLLEDNKDFMTINIYPQPGDIFNWTLYTRPDEIKIIFLGQDPYQSNIATGVGFAVNSMKDIKPPITLQNLFQKLNAQMNGKYNFNTWYYNGNIYQYTKHILFLNVGLKVYKDKNKLISQLKYWRIYTQNFLKNLSKFNKDIIYVTFGTDAKKVIDNVFQKTDYYKKIINEGTLY